MPNAVRMALHLAGRLVILAYGLLNVAGAWVLRPLVVNVDVPLENWNEVDGIVTITTVIMLAFGLGLIGWCFRRLPRYGHLGLMA